MEDMDIPDLVDMAKLAEHAERFEDMAKYMKIKVQKQSHLTMDERSLLSVAFKNVIGSRRSSWRTLQAQEAKEGNTKGIPHEIIKQYKEKVETELTEIINEVIELLDSKLILKKDNSEITDEKEIETQIFYYKMKGDYCRYKAEYDETEQIVSDGEAAYKAASELAVKLPTTNPTSLGLALNYSVFFYEIKKDGAKACSIAKKAFDDAVKDLDSAAATESTYKDSTLIMQLLRDNLTLWTSENEDDDQQETERD